MDPAQLRSHAATSQTCAPFHKASVKLGDGEPRVLLEWLQARKKGINPHPNPWETLTSPESTWTSTCSDITVSCYPPSRPTTCHNTPLYDRAFLPPPTWMRLPTRAGLWGGIAWDLFANDRVQLGKGRGSHLNMRRERAVALFTITH